VYYANASLCESNVDAYRGYPERPIDEDTGKMRPWEPPYILLVDRGGCTFVKKVRNAQRAGAAAVLIADNMCLCSYPECQPDKEGEACEVEEPIMADDGSGSDISIPAFLLFKQDADPIRDALMSNTQVRVEMSFSMPSPDGRVEYDLWTTPTDSISRPIEQNFKEAAVALGDKALFTPHMYIYDGIKAGCDQNGVDECYNLCTNAGRYCAIDPDEDLDSGISGADVIRESLRRLCVWSLAGSDGIGSKYWNYIKEFNARCYSDPIDKPEMFMDAACVSGALSQAGVKESDVNRCMDDSGGLEGNVKNSLLDKELQAKDAAGIILIPTLFVNQAPVRGSLSFATAFKAICAGYAGGLEPAVCKQCSDCLDEAKCVQAGGKCTSGFSTSGGVSFPIFASSMILMTGSLLAIGYVVHRRQQRHMQEQVRGIIAVRLSPSLRLALNR
jgi:hypothetical protein